MYTTAGTPLMRDSVARALVRCVEAKRICDTPRHGTRRRNTRRGTRRRNTRRGTRRRSTRRGIRRRSTRRGTRRSTRRGTRHSTRRGARNREFATSTGRALAQLVPRRRNAVRARQTTRNAVGARSQDRSIVRPRHCAWSLDNGVAKKMRSACRPYSASAVFGARTKQMYDLSAPSG